MKKFSIIALFILSLAVIFTACGKTPGGSEDSTGDNSGKVKVKEITNIADYTIVRGDQADNTVKDALTILRNAIKEKNGAQLSVGTDFGSKSEYEILLGETNRSASIEAMEKLGGDYDYIIKLVGNRIVILGGSSEATAEAVNVFIENFMPGGKIAAPEGDGYIMLRKYPLEKLTVDGKDISNFKFYYIKKNQSETAKSNLSFAEEACERLGQKMGRHFTLADAVSEQQNYIMVDTSELNYTKGAIKVEDGNLILYGSYHSIDYVMDYFFDTLLGENKEVAINETIELDSGDLPTIYSKDDLMKLLEYSYNTNDIVIVGDQIRGLRTSPNFWLDIQMNGGEADDIEYVGTGKLPAVLGVDLGRCGFRLPFLADDQWYSISQIVCELVDYAAQGGIVTVSSHFTNPTGYESDWKCDRGNLGDEQGWKDLITEGTEINTEFKKELEMNARVLKALSDAGVPVIWRPMHEMNTPSFWFSIAATGKTLDASCYQNAWRYIYNYFTEEWGIDTMIWNYSPNRYYSERVNVMYCYPGDEYVDIVGIDWYTGGKYEIGADHKPYADLMKSGKITNLCEVGISDSLIAESYEDQRKVYSAQDFWSNFERMYQDGYKIGYLLTFNAQHTLAFLPGGDEIMALETVIDLSEMPALFEEVTGFKVG
ncbi:MAG: hypothetical protein IJZ89_07050 [Clostridia bacterium]|nr:hypothetical protein [Clostridia bacterium]